jgi:hypothetical protein
VALLLQAAGVRSLALAAGSIEPVNAQRKGFATMTEMYGVGIAITGADDEGLNKLSAFLSLSRSGKALVSNEVEFDNGSRSILVHVRKVDGELATAGVLMSEGVTRSGLVKSMRDAGVKVESLKGVSAAGAFRVH